MTSPLPAHLSQLIQDRIAVLRELREAWPPAEPPLHPLLKNYPTVREHREHHRRPPGRTPTFPDRRYDEARSTS